MGEIARRFFPRCALAMNHENEIVQDCHFCDEAPRIFTGFAGHKFAKCYGADCPIHGFFIPLERWNKKNSNKGNTMQQNNQNEWQPISLTHTLPMGKMADLWVVSPHRSFRVPDCIWTGEHWFSGAVQITDATHFILPPAPPGN